MSKRITMQSIADRLGVSKYTVSQALSGKPGISEATRRQVTAMARTLGYRLGPEGPDAAPSEEPSGSGAASAGTGAPLVLVWMNEYHLQDRSFWQRVLDGIHAACAEQGWLMRMQADRLVEARTGETPAAGSSLAGSLPVEEDAQRRAVGVIIAGECPADKLLTFRRLGLPMVLVDHEEPLLEADSVLNANLDAGRMACHQLLSQGCRSLVFIGQDSLSVSFRERWWGCRLAVEDWSQKLNAARRTAPAPLRPAAPEILLRKWTIPYHRCTWPAQLEKRLHAVKPEEAPGGFVCANDEIALKLLRQLGAGAFPLLSGCRVVGIDNITDCVTSQPPLTTVELAKERLGARAVESLVRRIRLPDAGSERIVLSARLVVRGSG